MAPPPDHLPWLPARLGTNKSKILLPKHSNVLAMLKTSSINYPQGFSITFQMILRVSFPSLHAKFVFEIPADSMDSYAYIETAREKDGEQQIWILTDAHYIVYQPGLDDHFIVPKYPQNASDIVKSVLSVEQLVVAQDGSVWGRNIIHGDKTNGLGQIPLFSVYNEEKKQFELIDSEFKFNGSYLQDYYCTYYIEPRLLIETDANNNYWIFHPTNGLYKFDPAKQTLDEFHELDNLRFCDAAIAPDGTIFLQILEDDNTIWTSRLKLHRGELLKFNPETKILKPLTNTNPLLAGLREYCSH